MKTASNHASFLLALRRILEALGMYHPIETPCYVTVEPPVAVPGEMAPPLPLVIRSWYDDHAGMQCILAAHYYYAFGRLCPCPEFVLNGCGEVIWRRSAVRGLHRGAVDCPRDVSVTHFYLARWAETLQHTYVGAAVEQRHAGRAHIHCVPEADVVWSIEEQRRPGPILTLNEKRDNYRRCLPAFEAFVQSRAAVHNAFRQATYQALRPSPENAYLLCSPNGWYTLSESDYVQHNRWLSTQSDLSRGVDLAFYLPPAMECRAGHFEQAFGALWSGRASEIRALPEMARELGYAVPAFIEQEVSWYIDDFLAHLQQQRALYQRAYHLADDDESGVC